MCLFVLIYSLILRYLYFPMYVVSSCFVFAYFLIPCFRMSLFLRFVLPYLPKVQCSGVSIIIHSYITDVPLCAVCCFIFDLLNIWCIPCGTWKERRGRFPHPGLNWQGSRFLLSSLLTFFVHSLALLSLLFLLPVLQSHVCFLVPMVQFLVLPALQPPTLYLLSHPFLSLLLVLSIV